MLYFILRIKTPLEMEDGVFYSGGSLSPFKHKFKIKRFLLGVSCSSKLRFTFIFRYHGADKRIGGRGKRKKIFVWQILSKRFFLPSDMIHGFEWQKKKKTKAILSSDVFSFEHSPSKAKLVDGPQAAAASRLASLKLQVKSSLPDWRRLTRREASSWVVG